MRRESVTAKSVLFCRYSTADETSESPTLEGSLFIVLRMLLSCAKSSRFVEEFASPVLSRPVKCSLGRMVREFLPIKEQVTIQNSPTDLSCSARNSIRKVAPTSSSAVLVQCRIQRIHVGPCRC